MPQEPLTLVELHDLIEKTKSEMPYSDIYWRLRAFRLKRVQPPTVELTRYCIALHRLGLPINTRTISFFSKESFASILDKLHRLGDAHILVQKRKPFKRKGMPSDEGPLTKHIVLEWTLQPSFLKTTSGATGDNP